MFWQHGYLLNQILFTKLLIIADDLSKYASFVLVSLCVLSLLLCMKRGEKISSVIGNSMMLDQLDAGSINVRHIKSISVLPLPLRVYGRIRSTYSDSVGFVIIDLGGRYPYLSCWCDRIYSFWYVYGQYFQYCSSTSQQIKSLWDMYFQDVADSGHTSFLSLGGSWYW